MADKNIYDLKLHEETVVSYDNTNRPLVWCKRVPGGWLYSSIISYGDSSFQESFVPYNNEYQTEAPPYTKEGNSDSPAMPVQQTQPENYSVTEILNACEKYLENVNDANSIIDILRNNRAGA